MGEGVMDHSTLRHREILTRLDSYGKVTVSELAEAFGVTHVTIRRDLTAMEAAHMLKRVHGGAVKISFYPEEPAILDRRDLFYNEKLKIAKLASTLIEDQMSIFIDIGTTTAQLVHFLKEKRNLQIFTNSFEATLEMIKLINQNLLHGRVIFVGGEVNAKQMTVSGTLSEAFTDQLYVDIAFIGVGGAHISGGITGYEDREVMLSKRIIQNSRVSVAMLDRSKIGVKNLYKIADFKDLDVIVSDQPPPKEWAWALNKFNVSWIGG